MTDKRRLSAEEETLWRWAMRQTRSLPRDGGPLGAPKNIRLSLLQTGKKSSAATARTPRGVPPVPARLPPAAAPSAGLDPGLIRRVARGRRRIDAVLDLHGDRQDEAYLRLSRFVGDAAARGQRTLLVITGKGSALRSGPERTPGVLRRMVPLWLRQAPLSDMVSGFEPAHRRHGGGGAFYVVVRRRK